MRLRKRQAHAEMYSASLNDIMFFLLLFFLILSTLGSPRVIKVLLPKADASQSTTRKPVTLTVTADKKYFVEGREIPFSSLEEQLSALVDKHDATVVIRPARDLQIQDLVDVLQIGVKNNMKMVLATAKSSAP
jgi:biopolymer transport protein ExbD